MNVRRFRDERRYRVQITRTPHRRRELLTVFDAETGDRRVNASERQTPNGKVTDYRLYLDDAVINDMEPVPLREFAARFGIPEYVGFRHASGCQCSECAL